jgi:phosphoglycerol transferase MdoB-like AlkP superfamily enzyme
MNEALGEGVNAGEQANGGRARRLLGLLFSQRVRPLWITALVLWAMFLAFRTGLFLATYGVLRGAPGKHMFRCFLNGLRFDAMPIGYMLLPMALLLSLAPNSAFKRAWLRRTVTAYTTVFVAVVAIVEIIGAGFFLHEADRLNGFALNYLEHYHEVFGFIWAEYPMWALIFVPVFVIGGFYFLFQRLFWKGRAPSHPRWARAVCGLVVVAVCVLLCRAPIGLNDLYFSDNKALCQLTMNNFNTFVRAAWSSLTDAWDEAKFFPFPPSQQRARKAADMLLQRRDVPAGDPVNPLWRTTRTDRAAQRLNVVLIMMESMAGSNIGALGTGRSQTPHLDGLCRRGLFFERMYAVGYRTNRGITACLCGHPDLGGPTVLKREKAIGRFLSLPAILSDRGYRTMFFYGGDPEFDNMEEFLCKGGIHEVYGEDCMSDAPQHLMCNWGYHDEVLFGKVHEVLSAVPRGQAFFAFVLTVSNHEKWDVPGGEDRPELLDIGDGESDHSLLCKRANASRYADWALGEFFDRAEQEDAPYLYDTLFVLVADHGMQAEFDQSKLLDVPSFRIPCLFYAPRVPGLVPPGRISTVCSQTDVPPTVLSLLGGTYRHCFLGRNVLEVRDEGFALLHQNDRLGFVRGDVAIVLPPRSWPRMYRTDGTVMQRVPTEQVRTEDMLELQLQMLSYYGMARDLYDRVAYRRPPLSLAGRRPGDGALAGRH